MKLNPDCVRDVMLVLEENLSITPGPYGFSFCSMYVSSVTVALKEKKYSLCEVAYTVLQLAESGYIVVSNVKMCDQMHGNFDPGKILYITPKGHEIIASFHSQQLWSVKIRPVLSMLGNVSLSIIESVSKGFATAAIEKLISGNLSMP